MDLIHLHDADGTRCVVRVTGRSHPGVLTDHDTLRADVLVSADFVDARLEVHLLPDDLDAWQRDLTTLAPGGKAGIGGDRALAVLLHMGDDGWLSIAIDDPDRLSVALGLRPEGDWIEEHRARLEAVRRSWPGEVVETSPGAYEWRTGGNGERAQRAMKECQAEHGPAHEEYVRITEAGEV